MIKTIQFAGAAALALVGFAGHAAAQNVTYTDAQATQGAGEYAANCAKCHGNEAQGADGGPPLAGGQFDGVWRGGPAKDLYAFIAEYMPGDNPGKLREGVYVAVLAHILKLNKIPSGTAPLVANPPGVIPK